MRALPSVTLRVRPSRGALTYALVLVWTDSSCSTLAVDLGAPGDQAAVFSRQAGQLPYDE